jgi:predicted naringenin-chalcone synthase
LLHVTCTGYAAPSAAQKLVEKRSWNDNTRVTHVYHMGCYASLPALRIASGFLASSASPGGRCDLAHTEVCTLHLNPARHDPEQLVVQSLFADGYIRYSLSRAEATLADGFAMLGFLERIVPDSLDDIGWTPGEFGMRMSLSRNVPDRIASVLEPFMQSLAVECGLSRDALREAMYAVHPGGPRILDKVEEWLKLEPRQLQASRAVLFDRLLGDRALPAGMPVVSLAFGPGLTVYGSVMRLARAG